MCRGWGKEIKTPFLRLIVLKEKNKLQKINFEKSLERLEEITKKLENGDLTLDSSLKLFEEGIKLSRFCQKKLTEAEQQLEVLKSVDAEDYSEEELENSKEEDGDDEDEEPKPEKKKKKINEKDTNANGKEGFLF
jgi:exodeoxyribonuclease VII small subunit